MRTIRTITASLGIAILVSFTLIGCESEAAAPEQAQAQAQADEGVFIFDKPELYNKVPDRYVFLALGKKLCEDISNPVKKQDCANNINVKNELSKAYSEKIGKTETFILSTRPGYTEPKGSIDGKLSSKPESKQLCEMNINFQNATQVFDKEEVMNIRKQIDEANADRKRSGQGKLNGSEIVSCLALFENKYIYEFGYNDFALFANKEAAMNFEPKGGSEVTLKLKKVVFFYNTDRTGSEHVYEIKIYDFASQDLLAGERKTEAEKAKASEFLKKWSKAFPSNSHKWNEAMKLCSSRGERLPTKEDWQKIIEIRNSHEALYDEFAAGFETVKGQDFWSATTEPKHPAYNDEYATTYEEQHNTLGKGDKGGSGYGSVRCIKD